LPNANDKLSGSSFYNVTAALMNSFFQKSTWIKRDNSFYLFDLMNSFVYISLLIPGEWRCPHNFWRWVW